MKNLKLCWEDTRNIQLLSEEKCVLHPAVDIAGRRLFFVCSDANIWELPLKRIKYRQSNNVSEVAHSGRIDLELGDCVEAVDYLMEKEALVAGTSSGSLLIHNVQDCVTEVVGRVEGGVESITPSPDGALISVVARVGRMLVMTQDWDVLYEIDLIPCNFDIDRDYLSGSCNPLQMHVCWRGDGKYFATLSRLKYSFTTQNIKVWERESGNLHASSELKLFSGTSIDWMPSGAKIVASYDTEAENRCPSIVFFERNGLERSSFSIDASAEATVEVLKWNCSSDLLAALVRFQEYDAVKLWYFNNNHWYLKQELQHQKVDRVKFMWDPTRPLHLILWTHLGGITSYDFVWVTAVMENSTALVVDGSRLLVTPLSLLMMPPPLALFNLKCSAAIHDFAFLFRNLNSLLAISLSDGSLCVVDLPSMDTWEIWEGKELMIEPSELLTAIGRLNHLTWLDSCSVLAAFSSKSSQGVSLLEFELVCSGNSDPQLLMSSGWRANISQHLYVDGSIVGIVPNPAKNGAAFVQFEGGSIYDFSSESGMTEMTRESCMGKRDCDNGFFSSCPWMRAVAIYERGTQKIIVFGLDESNRLQVSRKIICHNCCSFSFYSNNISVGQQVVTHLILTTHQDFLCILNINHILNGCSPLRFDGYASSNVKTREDYADLIPLWERGAKLAGIIHGDEAAVILQTNRGNLECIHPRKLVLASIGNMLVERRFKDAFIMLRRHRLDLNVIVDHCGWQSFCQWAAEFVQKVNNLSHITDFICSIKNENVMEKLYRNYKLTADAPNTEVSGGHSKEHAEGKVSSVLQAVKVALEEKIPECPAREFCILTALSCHDPPALEEALKRIKVIHEKELAGVDQKWRNLYPSAEDSVKHLLWLSDPDAVYEAALGLYDLKLAALIALNSLKDPKEFLPFLQGLERMPLLVMKYTVDVRLRRYTSALEHIFSAGEPYFEDYLQLMKNNPQLFPMGLQLLPSGQKKAMVLELWGDYLFEQRCFDDAAMSYMCCLALQKALKAYRASGNWKNVLSVAGLLKFERTQILQLANELCEELNALGRSAEAGRIAFEYCGDVIGGIRYLLCAREWAEALRIGLLHGREDLISDIKAAASECASTIICEYEEGREKLGKFVTRYLAVRQKRLLLKAKLGSVELYKTADVDSASETGSVFSGMSVCTKETVKGSGASLSSATISQVRNHQFRKKKAGKIRTGSPGEELALVDHLKGLVLTKEAQHELKSLLLALVMLGMEDVARKVQFAGESYQVSQVAAIKLVEDTVGIEIIDDQTQNLKHNIEKVKCELSNSDIFSWQCKVLVPQ